MKSLQRLIVMVLLGVWCFPAVSLAKPLPAPSAEVAPRDASSSSAKQTPGDQEGAALAARERQAQDLQDWRGGGVSIYIGSGALLVLVIVLLVLLI